MIVKNAELKKIVINTKQAVFEKVWISPCFFLRPVLYFRIMASQRLFSSVMGCTGHFSGREGMGNNY